MSVSLLVFAALRQRPLASPARRARRQFKAAKVVDVRFPREKMLPFAEVVRVLASRLEMAQGVRRIIATQRIGTQEDMRRDVLCRDKTFTAFPWVETACEEDRQSSGTLAGEVVERNQFDREIVPLVDEVPAPLKLSQAYPRFRGGSLPKLIEFVEQARVRRVRAARLFVAFGRAVWLPAHVVVSHPEIAPGNGELRIEAAGLLPMLDGFFAPVFVVEQVAEIVVRAGIVGVMVQRRFQHDHRLKPGRETVVGRRRAARLIPPRGASRLLFP